MAAFELDIFPGDWGIPSVDVVCLQVMAYSRFSGAPVEIHKTNCSSFKFGVLPLFHHGKKITLSQFDEIKKYLAKQNYNADHNLTTKQCSDVRAYTTLLRDKLYPAIQHMWWIDTRNYTEMTRPWYAKVLPFPYNYFLPGMKQKDVMKNINSIWNFESLTDSQKETAIYKDAQECLTLLSQKLGSNEFFLGRNPCSLDAMIFGYLAPLLKAPFRNASLQNHLKACENLTLFIARILQRYFPLSPEEIEAENKKKKEESEKESQFPNKWRNGIFAGLFALSAMVSYAFATGIIQMEIIEEAPDDDEEDKEDIDFPDSKKK